MCWYHMIAAVKKKLPKVLNNVEHEETIKDCIRVLHNEQDRNIFKALLVLFEEYLSHIKEEGFKSYFQSTWVRQHPGWIRCRVPAGLPLTNNPLESFNAKLKQLSHHKRVNLGAYMEEMADHIRTESVKKSDESDCDLRLPTVTSRHWEDALAYLRRCENMVVCRCASITACGSERAIV